jgi:hypothetical protein
MPPLPEAALALKVLVGPAPQGPEAYTVVQGKLG